MANSTIDNLESLSKKSSTLEHVYKIVRKLTKSQKQNANLFRIAPVKSNEEYDGLMNKMESLLLHSYE
jgi:hypothetical protein